VKRSPRERLLRNVLRSVLPNPEVFKFLLGIGRYLKPVLPARLASKLPRQIAPAGERPGLRHALRVLMLEGCVQPGLSPNTNAAASRVLDRLGISVQPISEAGCC